MLADCESTLIRTPASGTLTPTVGCTGFQYDRLSSNTGCAVLAPDVAGLPVQCSENESACCSEKGASYIWIRPRHGWPSRW